MPRNAVRTALIPFVLVTLFAVPSVAQDRTQEVLGQARSAIAAGKTLPSVTSLAANASVRRVVQPMNIEMSSDVQLEFLPPDKYRRTESINVGSLSRVVTTGLNGSALLYDDGGAAAMTGIDPTAPGPQREQLLKTLRHDSARLLTTWLLMPPGEGFTFASAGVAEAPEGTADILDVKGPGDFVLRLFLDTRTHRLLMATYDTQTIALDKEKLQSMQSQVAQKAQGDPKKLAEALREAMEAMPKKTVTVRMNFSDYRTDGGLSLPHQMTVDTGQGVEEWTISSFKVNPAIKPERFEKK